MSNCKHKTGDRVTINYVGKVGCSDNFYLANRGKVATIKKYCGHGLYELAEFPDRYWAANLLQKAK